MEEVRAEADSLQSKRACLTLFVKEYVLKTGVHGLIACRGRGCKRKRGTDS